MGIKQWADKQFKVDEAKISKMASVDIASGGQLILPEKGESVNIRFLSPPKMVLSEKIRNKNGAVSARCVIYGKETDLQYDIWISSTIYKGILAEFQKAKIPVDDDLRCIVGRVFTIAGREWSNAPKDTWNKDELTGEAVPPKTYSVALRLDLELKVIEPAGTGTSPDLINF